MIESALLAHIYGRSEGLRRFPQVEVGPGDDCAVLAVPGGGSILLTVDHLVEGRHVELLTESPSPGQIDLIARKAIARSVSDIAAMGGTPLASLATACMPPGFPQNTADQLFDRMNHWAAHFGAPLIGGDISQSPPPPPGSRGHFVLTTTLIGTPHPKRGPVLRSTAKPGDLLCVTGKLGNSFASGRHLSFTPRLTEAAWLCTHASPTSMIDISDGLGRDAGRIAEASNVSITIEASLLPIHSDLSAHVDSWRHALADGEDYELLFTIPPHATLDELERPTGTIATVIGRVEHSPVPRSAPWPPTCRVIAPDGTPHDAANMGWDHAS